MDQASWPSRSDADLKFLLVGPFDPLCGEYTFLAPPLGVWRLAGALGSAGVQAEVFDPNACGPDVEQAFERVLRDTRWDLIGISTTAMTLRYDLALAHQARRLSRNALLVAGGMEATFNPERMFELGPPFDLIVLGEGEKPLREIADRLRIFRGSPEAAGSVRLDGIRGTALRDSSSRVQRIPQLAMTHDELTASIQSTPYERMPYAKYWARLEEAYRLPSMPYKADREARLAEIRSVRLITLNYCPMGCTFCSSTNFLHEAQGGIARVARLDERECMGMLRRIVATHPDVRTIIFQDDIFVFTQDRRVLALCEAIVAAKQRGELPRDLQFISTNRIDAMTPERLRAMRQAGFRVLGFGVENFSKPVLTEFNKGQIHRHIEPTLSTALEIGITPFLDLILSSPASTVADIAENVRQASRWLLAGCEVGIYPYVIPFSGAALASDPRLRPQTVFETLTVPGTRLGWKQAVKILPADVEAYDAITAIEERFERSSERIRDTTAHLPSRARSLLWILAAHEVLRNFGYDVSEPTAIRQKLHSFLGTPADDGPVRNVLSPKRRRPVYPAPAAASVAV